MELNLRLIQPFAKRLFRKAFVNSIKYLDLIDIFKDTGLFTIIVLPLRKLSFREMINERHNNRLINLKVLENLKPIVCDLWGKNPHGDLKEKCNLKNDNYQTNFDYTI